MSSGFETEGPVTKTNIGRLTNAIFAFTLLLLFKNVKLPSFADSLSDATVDNFGLMQIPDIMSFINAFIIIAMFWIITFHIFHQIQRIDRMYIYLHFGLLVMIIFIPISSHLYQLFINDSLLGLFFHVNLLFIGILLIAEWKHCNSKKILLKSECTGYRIKCITRKLYYIPVTALIGCILVLFDIPLTRNLYYGTMILFFLDWLITPYILQTMSRGNHDD